MQKLKQKISYFSFIIPGSAALFIPGSVLADSCNDSTPGGVQQCLKGNPIVTDLNTIIDFLSAGVGILVVGTIILGGIQYVMAGDSAEAIGKAKQRVINGLIALVVFLFIFSFLQWIIPGGVFG